MGRGWVGNSAGSPHHVALRRILRSKSTPFCRGQRRLDPGPWLGEECLSPGSRPPLPELKNGMVNIFPSPRPDGFAGSHKIPVDLLEGPAWPGPAQVNCDEL